MATLTIHYWAGLPWITMSYGLLVIYLWRIKTTSFLNQPWQHGTPPCTARPGVLCPPHAIWSTLWYCQSSALAKGCDVYFVPKHHGISWAFFFQVIGGSGSGAVGCLDFGYCTSSKRFPVRHGSSTSCWLSEALSATDEAFKPQLARTCSRSVCIFARRYSVEQTWVMAKLTEEHWRPGDAEADTGSDTWRLVSETYPSCWKIDWICSSKHAQVEENQWISMDYPWIDLHWMATEPHCSHHFALGDAWSAMGKQGFDSRTALANVACHQPGICWIGWKISKASSGTSNMFNESEGFSRPLDFHLHVSTGMYMRYP